MDAGKRAAPAPADLRVLIVVFTLGVLFVHAQPALPPAAWLLLPLVLALPRTSWRAPLLWAAAGVALSLGHAQLRLAERWPTARHGEEVTVQGWVASLPESARDPHRAETRTWRFRFDPADPALPDHLRVSWYRSEQQPRAGECWQLRLKLRTPHGSLNPGGFDYEAWLFRQGIGGLATVRAAQRCAADGGYRLLRLRQALVEALQRWLPGHPALPLVMALTVGEQSAIDDEHWDVFRRTGTSHLVAISGFNVAIVAGFAFFVGRWLWCLWPPLLLRLPAPKAGWIASGVVAVAYAGLAGFEAPVLRATLMLLFVITAGFANRLGQPSRVLALAWLLILALDPLAVLSPGLWLSFGAVAAIFYATGSRAAAPHWLRASVSLQLMLSLALLPLTLLFFHGLSWPAPLVNLVAVPLFALLTPWLLLAMALSALWPAAGVPLLGWGADALSLIHQGLEAAAAWPVAWIGWSPSLPALALAFCATILLFAPRGLPLRGLALLCCVPALLPPSQAPRRGFELAVLDVGQGLAVVVRTAHHVLLYDAGPAFEDGFDAGESVVAPYLLTRGIHRLDRLLLSHGDNDHAGGVEAVRRLLRVDDERGTPGHPPCIEGLRWNWDGVAFETLHPDGEGGWSDNNGSCVLRVAWQGQVALLSGDIEKAAERRLLEDHGEQLRADILIAPHHGSRTSSTPAFVAAVAPRYVIYGAAWRSHFGHPRPEVAARYAQLGARQFVTGVVGAVEMRPEGEGWQIREWRREAAHFWNALPAP